MILYKYMSNRSFLGNLKVRFTQPCELNDPRELAPNIQIRNPIKYATQIVNRNFQAGYLRMLLEHPSMTPEEAFGRCVSASKELIGRYASGDEDANKLIFDSIMKITNRTIGVFSLTEFNNNELMWAHYAASHTGYVVGLDMDNEFFRRREGDPKTCGELTNVIYSDTPPTVYVDPGTLDIPRELFFTKTTKWSYEHEWRLIRQLENADEVVDGRVHLFSMPREAIVSLTFGAKFPDREIDEIKAAFSSLVPGVNFHKANFNHRGEFIIS